ncbi:MAG: sensor domain-containing diguanylate cyclase [Clostridia bacterium]|nr:sensor domain-containing diguanylate cyclase [Clostridia bacterium]
MQGIQKQEKKRTYWFRFLGYFVIMAAILSTIAGVFISSLIHEQRTHKQYLLESKGHDMELQMSLLIDRVHAMRFMLMAEQGQPESFDVLAPLILKGWDDKTESFVQNVALAPQGIIRYVYPMKGNEMLVGYDLWKAAAPNSEAVETLRQGKVYITPPIDLVQGGRGMNICLPITLPGEADSWGMAAIVVDTDKLVRSFGLKDISEHGAGYSLEYRDMEGNYVTMASRGKLEQPVIYEFQTESMQWRLSMTGTLDKAGVWTVVLLCAATFVVSLLLASNLAGRKLKKQMTVLFRELANTDSVTGCSSRHFVYEKLVDQKSGSWNYPEMKYSLAILDVDHFKDVNDTLGHEVGDIILQEMAKILLNSLSRDKGDCAIRFGGDEFVLLFGNRSREQVKDILTHILSSVRMLDIPEMKGMQVSVSIGGVHPDEMQEEATYKNMLRTADEKLYRAKESGRNRCIV